MDHESLGVWEILDRAVIMTPHKKHKKKEKEGSCGQKLIVGQTCQVIFPLNFELRSIKVKLLFYEGICNNSISECPKIYN